MATLLAEEKEAVISATRILRQMLSLSKIRVTIERDFTRYIVLRRSYGDPHLNQAFDPQYTCFSKDDFWLLATNEVEDAVATCCVRRFNTEDFYCLIQSQILWFSRIPDRIHQEFKVERGIPPFGGEITHGGGLWIRQDLRGSSKLAFILPRLARALSFYVRPFDHDTGMIRNAPTDSPRATERKAVFAGTRTYGFARVARFVDGWFPPEGRNAIMFLCHATKAEAIASLLRNVSLPTNTGIYEKTNLKNFDNAIGYA